MQSFRRWGLPKTSLEQGQGHSTLNGGRLGCLTTVIFGQSPGDGEEAGSADVSRTFQAHRDGQASGEDKVLLTRE